MVAQTAPSIYTSPSGPLVLAGARGQWGGNDVAITAPAVAVALDADDATYQIMSPSATVAVTLPSSVPTPGKELYFINLATGDFSLTITRHADDGGGVIATVRPGEELHVKSTGTVAQNYRITQRLPTSMNVNQPAPLAGNVTLGATAALSRNLQNLDSNGASRTVALPLADNSPGVWFWISNRSFGGAAVPPAADQLVVTPDAGDVGPTITLGPGDSVMMVSIPGTGFAAAMLKVSSAAVADQADLAAGVVLSPGSETYQILDCGGVDRTMTLPSAIQSPAKRFVISNRSAGGVEILDVDLHADDGGATLASLFPGDKVEVVSTGATGGGDNQGFQIVDTAALKGFDAITANGGGADVDLDESNGKFLHITHDDAAGAGIVRMPALGVAVSGLPYFMRVVVGADAGEDVEIRSTVADGDVLIEDVTQAVVGANGVRTIIVFNDGGAWRSFGQMTST